MSQTTFLTAWMQKFSDPYALLGVSVTADDRRVLKRYRNVAKILHPDSYGSGDTANKELASHLFARLVSPAYQKLKLEKERAESLATLRLPIRRMHREGELVVQGAAATRLLKMLPKEAEVFYEQTVEELAASQYQPLAQFDSVTEQLVELNRVYLYIKLGTPVIREKRTGLVATSDARPIEFNWVLTDQDEPTENYAQRHYERAQEYVKQAAWSQAVLELRDAIRIEPDQSEYHALIGLVYLKQDLKGMATVHFRQALKLNPQDALALEYAAKLNIKSATNQSSSSPAQTKNQSAKPTPRPKGFFGLFGARK